MVEVTESPSILFRGMAGSRMPIATAHGEGLAAFDGPAAQARALTCLRFVDNRGAPTETYPLNPNGSPGGITGLTTPDGRFTILMPHPERVFRAVQCSWHPADAWRREPVAAALPQRAGLGRLNARAADRPGKRKRGPRPPFSCR